MNNLPAEWPLLSTLKRLNCWESGPLRATLLIIAVGVLIAMVAFWTYSSENNCGMIEGATYQSSREVDNFFGETIHPTVSFANGRFTWAVSDMLISGVYECQSGKIIAQPSYDSAKLTGQLSSGIYSLLWNGETYVRIFR